MEKPLTTTEIASALAVEPRTIALLVRRENLPAERRNGQLCYYLSRVATWSRNRHGVDLLADARRHTDPA